MASSQLFLVTYLFNGFIDCFVPKGIHLEQDLRSNNSKKRIKMNLNEILFVVFVFSLTVFAALVEDRESKSGNPCDKAMRMSIKVRPKFVHGHTTSTKPQTTTAKISATTTTSKPVKTTTTFTQTIKRTSVLPSLTATSGKYCDGSKFCRKA